MKKLYFLIVATIVAITLMTLIAGVPGSEDDGVVRIGYTSSPHLAPLFVAVEYDIFEDKGLKVELKRFDSTSTAGYALLANKVDMTFLEPKKSFRLIDENADSRIKIAGTIIFDYGAVLIVREDLNIRLGDLKGMTVAITSMDCVIFNQFKHDAQRHGIDIKDINFMNIDSGLMLPALEAGRVDAILTKSSYALLAQAEGHTILYQNWNVMSTVEDLCCPPHLKQIEYFMLVKDLEPRFVNGLDAALRNASEMPLEDSRNAIMKHSGFPMELLQPGFPVAQYQEIGQELKQELGDWVWTRN